MGPEKYFAMEKHFHILTASLLPVSSTTDKKGYECSNEASYGLSFAHEKVAERFHQAAMQLMPNSNSKTSIEPHSLNVMTSADDEEMIDYPPLSLSSKLPLSYSRPEVQEEEAGALTCSGHFPLNIEDSCEEEKPLHALQVSYGGTAEDEGLEDVDGRDLGVKSRLKNKEKRSRRIAGSRESWMCSSSGSSRGFLESDNQKLTRRSESMHDIRISYPTSFKHLAHIHPGTPFNDLKQVINTGVSPYSLRSSTEHNERTSDGKVKLRNTPPVQSKVHRHNSLPSKFPKILVTPAIENKRRQVPYPPPPPQVMDFKKLVEELRLPETDNESGLTDSMEKWQVSFQSAVGKLIEKKLTREPNLWSLTQSGRAEKNERKVNRVPSVIVHDHGMVYL